ncbi:hypothetical protein EMCRGX_G022490 [Ephydatia muelleri]
MTTAESKKHNVEQSSLSGQLLSAVDQGILGVVLKILNKPGVDVNEPNKHGETALHIASGYGRLNMVKMLHQFGAHVDAEDKMGDTPLYWATRYGYSEVVQYLKEQGASVNHQNKAGETAAHVAARYGHPEVMMELGRAGANLNMRDKDDETPLLCACWHGYHTLVECLVHAGCPLITPNKEGDSPLHVAAVRGHYDIVRLLCESGVDLDSTNYNGCAPIHLATCRNHLSIVQYLCECHCNVDILDKHGHTPLHSACKDGHLSLVHVLYAANCSLDIVNCDGATPLHLAAQNGHLEIVRYLCAAGCDLDVEDEHGLTAEDIAAGHPHVAALIHHLRQPECRAHHTHQLALGQRPLSRVKLLVCGDAGVGKTELVNSLKCHALRSIFRRRSTSDVARAIQRHTLGFSVQVATIPGEGEFSIWDFSGLEEYHIAHEPFLDGTNAIAMVVFSLRSPTQTQLAQVHYWLSLLRCKQRGEVVGYAGYNGHRPHVILVGSFANQQHNSEFQMESSEGLTASLAPRAPNNGDAVLSMAMAEFGESFEFCEGVHIVDTRMPQSKGMRGLRSLLGSLKGQVLKRQSWVPPMVDTLSQVIGQWRLDMLHVPVVTWNHFFEKTRSLVNPLVTETQLKAIAVSLHDMGEVVFIQQHPLSWCRQSQHFNLCHPRHGGYVFPALIKAQALFGLWEKDQLYQVYAGVRIVCRTTADVFSPGLFPCLQLLVQSRFPDDGNQEVTLWRGGLKCCQGNVEACVRHVELNKAVEILVRCGEDSRRQCAELLHQLYTQVLNTIHQTNPKTEVSRYTLSSRQLYEHRQDPSTYSSVEIFEAERTNGVARSSSGRTQEPIADLVCCGCPGLLMAAMSAPHAAYKDTSLRTRMRLSALLDPPDPMGRNWCLLALQLGVTEEVPAIDAARDQGSPTDKLLMAWGRSGSSTVAVLVDALCGIGRTDAAEVLIEGTSPFRTPNSSVVVNVSGVPLTSYLC